MSGRSVKPPSSAPARWARPSWLASAIGCNVDAAGIEALAATGLCCMESANKALQARQLPDFFAPNRYLVAVRNRMWERIAFLAPCRRLDQVISRCPASRTRCSECDTRNERRQCGHRGVSTTERSTRRQRGLSTARLRRSARSLPCARPASECSPATGTGRPPSHGPARAPAPLQISTVGARPSDELRVLRADPRRPAAKEQ